MFIKEANESIHYSLHHYQSTHLHTSFTNVVFQEQSFLAKKNRSIEKKNAPTTPSMQKFQKRHPWAKSAVNIVDLNLSSSRLLSKKNWSSQKNFTSPLAIGVSDSTRYIYYNSQAPTFPSLLPTLNRQSCDHCYGQNSVTLAGFSFTLSALANIESHKARKSARNSL